MTQPFSARAATWGRRCLLALAVVAGNAHAVAYTGVWDPAFGAPFTNLGWRGTASFFVPDGCLPAGTVDLSNAGDCANGAVVTMAQVELYDVTDGGTPTLSTLTFAPASLVVDTLRFVAGELDQLTTSTSSLLAPAQDLTAFGVTAGTQFGLFFTLDGPRLGWQDCHGYTETPTTGNPCSSGLNDSTQYRPTFALTRVPEPATAALAGLALLLAVASGRRRPV
jgi:hypothetical protein